MLSPGTRIEAYISDVGERITGTICGSYKNPALGVKQEVMVTDKKDMGFQALPSIGLEHQTVFVDSSVKSENQIVLLDAHTPASWAKTCKSVGVYAVHDFEFDQVFFPMGTVGRVSHFVGNSRISVLWNNANLSEGGGGGSREFPFLRCWEVPSEHLAFGLVDLSNGYIINPWGPAVNVPAKPKFQKEDVVSYISPRAARVAGEDGRSYSIVRGTVLTVLGVNRNSVTLAVAGNCQEKMVGTTLMADASSLALLPFPWIPKGATVRIKEEVVFRKKSLQHQTGVVLSPTDPDGDVGVQFPDDIGAGSLDGLGKDGRCLFVPARALEISG